MNAITSELRSRAIRSRALASSKLGISFRESLGKQLPKTHNMIYYLFSFRGIVKKHDFSDLNICARRPPSRAALDGPRSRPVVSSSGPSLRYSLSQKRSTRGMIGEQKIETLIAIAIQTEQAVRDNTRRAGWRRCDRRDGQDPRRRQCSCKPAIF